MTTKLKLRDPISALTHYLGALLSVFAIIFIIYTYYTNTGISKINMASSVIFAISMLLLYLSSGLYHSFNLPKDKLIYLRKLDHSMIYVLIAGSYTPFCLAIADQKSGITLFLIIWAMAITGIILKMFFFHIPRAIGTSFYIIMGWMIVFFIKDIIILLPSQGLFLLTAGGISYTIGGIFYMIKKPNLKYLDFHDVFHIFVLIGSGLHFLCIYQYILL